MTQWIFLGAALLLMGCPKTHQENPEIGRLQERIQAMEQELAGMDERIKAAEYDHGLQNQLGHEKGLIHSRVERLKMELRKLKTEEGSSH